MFKNSKKIVSLSLAAALSAIVFVTTGFAASNNVSGYEKAKEALFTLGKMEFIENATIRSGISAVEDGTEVMSGTMEAKFEDEYTYHMTAELNAGEENLSVEHYRDEENIYSKMGDIYRREDNYNPEKYSMTDEGIDFSENEKKLANVILDMFVGDTKNYFTNDNGHITMNLEKGQVPEVFQLMLSVMSESISKEMDENPAFAERINNGSGQDTFLEDRFFNLINGMAIDSVYVEGTINDDDILTDAMLTFTLTGEDKDGNPHVTTFTITNEITDIGTTDIEPFDEYGKVIMDSERNGSGTPLHVLTHDWTDGNGSSMGLLVEVTYEDVQEIDPAVFEDWPVDISVDGTAIEFEVLQAMSEEEFEAINNLEVNGLPVEITNERTMNFVDSQEEYNAGVESGQIDDEYME